MWLAQCKNLAFELFQVLSLSSRLEMLPWDLKTESNHPELRGTLMGCCSEMEVLKSEDNFSTNKPQVLMLAEWSAGSSLPVPLLTLLFLEVRACLGYPQLILAFSNFKISY